MAIVLTLCGAIATSIGVWRGFVVAREALAPLIHEGDPTRSAIDSTRPLLARTRFRLFARRSGIALAWLAVALYGLLLLEEAGVAR
jgi:hypothetical protein